MNNTESVHNCMLNCIESLIIVFKVRDIHQCYNAMFIIKWVKCCIIDSVSWSRKHNILTQSDQSQIIVNHGHNCTESKPEQTT